MATFTIDNNIFDIYGEFIVNRRTVSGLEAKHFVETARTRGMLDFNIAKAVKVKVKDSVSNLLNLVH